MKDRIIKLPPMVKVYFLILLFILAGAIFADVLMPYNPDATVLGKRNSPPVLAGGSMENILGTDMLGRDIFSRILYGTRISIAMSLAGLIFGGTGGGVLGLTAGYFGGWWDKLVMMAINFQQSIPFTLIILTGVVIFGRGIPVLLVFIGIAKWETYARLVRNLVLSIKEKQFIEAAKSYNVKPAGIITKHIFPGIRTYLIVLLALNFPSVLMLESSLSFIGIGVQPPTATLGQMVGEGRNYLMNNPWIAVLPTIVIVLLSYCVQHIGEWLRDEFDVRLDEG